MTRAGTGRTSRLLSTLLAAVIALAGVAAGPAAAARADVPALDFTLTGLSVTGSSPKDVLTLTALVANTGTTTAYGVQVYLWRSRDPIRDLPTLLEREATPVGTRMAPGGEHYVRITRSSEAFLPGTSTPVTLTATLKELGFDIAGAAYAVGAELIGTTDQSSAYQTAARINTFVTVPGRTKVPVTPIVLMSAPPTKLVNNLFRNEDLQAELTGRLSKLLDAAASPGHSWLIDPALLDEVRDQADGYQVRTGTGTVAGTGQAVATAWLARFAKLDHRDGGRTLFANPDVTGAAALGDDTVLDRAHSAGEAVAGIADLPLVVVPSGGLLTTDTRVYLGSAGADGILATNTAAAAALQGGDGRTPVLGATSTVPGDAKLPAIQRQQLALAAALVAGGAGQVRLLTEPDDVTADAQLRPGWVSVRGLSALLAGRPATSPTLTAVKPATLGQNAFRDLSRLAQDFDDYADVVPGSSLPDQADAALSRAAASAWVDDRNGYTATVGALRDQVGPRAIGDGITLAASQHFVMSSRANEFPVTVTNHLSETIRVRVAIVTENPQRLTVPTSAVITVDPGQSQTLNIRPEATANGVVTATGYVTTESGRRLTSGTPITIEVTDLGVVAWIIVIVSAVVLVGATTWRIRQVRRRDGADAGKDA